MAAPFRWFTFVISATALLLIGCGDSNQPAAIPTKRQVVVYSPHGQEILDDFEKKFEQANPDIDMIGRFVPTGQILSQLRIDKSSPQIDVWWGGTSAFFNEAAREGLLAPYEPTWAAALPENYKAKDRTWHAQFLQVPAFMFNSKITTPEQAPATFAALLDPAWANRVVIREPMDSGTMKTIFTGVVWSLGGPDHNPAPGYDYLKKLDAHTRKYLPNPQALYDQVARGAEGYISLWNVTDIIFQAEANSYPFGYRIPEEPVPVSLDPIGLVANAPHPEEAKLFYEFVTSIDSNVYLVESHYRIPARNDIPQDRLPERMKALKFTPMELDLETFDRLQADWMTYWREKIRDPNK